MSGSREASFEDIYKAHSGPVYRFVLYLTRNEALAEDVTAEAFLRVWSSAVPVRLDTVRGWLLTIARNLVFEQMRRTRRESDLTEVPAVLRMDEGIDAQRELHRVMAELAAMPETDRAALLLRTEGDLSYREIARILEMTEQAVRVRVCRARVRLGKVRKESYADRARSV